jgi:1-deoxy-D-xylulose-5-phosphate synthase
LQNLPVIFCLDRAGLVGEDGATHHGVFDLAYLRCIPNMIVYAPMNEIALRNILYTAQLGLNNPIAIRYPRGRGEIVDWQSRPEALGSGTYEKIEIGKANTLKEGAITAVLSNGTIGNKVTLALAKMNNPETIAHYDFAFVKPLDENALHTIFNKFEKIITIEDGVIKGGFGSAILEFASQKNYSIPVLNLGIPDEFIEQGTVEELHHYCKIDVESIMSILS